MKILTTIHMQNLCHPWKFIKVMVGHYRISLSLCTMSKAPECLTREPTNQHETDKQWEETLFKGLRLKLQTLMERWRDEGYNYTNHRSMRSVRYGTVKVKTREGGYGKC